MVSIDEIYGGSGGRFLNAQLCDEMELWGKPLTIADFEIREIKDRKKLVLYFEEIDDCLVLNKTNAEIIAEAYGRIAEGWKHKQIMLKKVKRTFRGKPVDAIEVEPLVTELEYTEEQENESSKKKSKKNSKSGKKQ